MTKVLIIDDDPGVRTVIRQALEDEGIDVVEAEDGRHGLDQHADHRPDLVITDIIMPDMEGIAAILALRQRQPDIPVIAISGGGRLRNKDFLEAARRMGANRVLPKPFDDDVLIGLVKELLREPASAA
ncbi:MAG: response regulator [Alphaproteobacteria bacterium]|nr:response regulator [Alphaproteobacteria bacterium]